MNLTRRNKAASGFRWLTLSCLVALAAIKKAAADGGHAVTVTFTPRRMDAIAKDTDVESYLVLKPVADGFRNYLKHHYRLSVEELLLDKAQLLTLSALEMTVLLGGMRVRINDDTRLGEETSDQGRSASGGFFFHIIMRASFRILFCHLPFAIIGKCCMRLWSWFVGCISMCRNIHVKFLRSFII